MSQANSSVLDYRKMTFLTLKTQFKEFIIGIFTLIIALVATLHYVNVSKVTLPLSFLHWQNQKQVTEHETAKSNTNNITYTVQEGQGLSQIVEQIYGNADKLNIVMQMNGITDPNQIVVGQVLKLPPKDSTTQAKEVTPTTAPTVTDNPTPTVTITLTPTPQIGEISAIQTGPVTIKGKKYKVQPGDGIWDIAVRAYGDGMMWTKIAEANHLDQSYNLEVGRVLKIPR